MPGNWDRQLSILFDPKNPNRLLEYLYGPVGTMTAWIRSAVKEGLKRLLAALLPVVRAAAARLLPSLKDGLKRLLAKLLAALHRVEKRL